MRAHLLASGDEERESFYVDLQDMVLMSEEFPSLRFAHLRGAPCKQKEGRDILGRAEMSSLEVRLGEGGQ